jgi:glycerophosphoryl diester phosphodiesterase
MYMLVLILAIMLIPGCAEPSSTGPAIVAHRGASYYAPENTIPAFLLAWEQHADAIEGDFHLTSDGVIVCIHDSHTGRVADTNMVVKDCTLEELKKLDVGLWKGITWKGTGIPTIAEVFKIVPEGKKIFVEVKTGTEILPGLYDEIKKSSLLTDQIVIISFNTEVIKAVKTSMPGYKAYWLSGFREDEHGNMHPGADLILATLEYTGADGFSSHHRGVNTGMIEAVLHAGYEYHVWTVNDGFLARDFKIYGAGSITTDRPGFIRNYLDSYEEGSGR